jgi:hypothetical protein
MMYASSARRRGSSGLSGWPLTGFSMHQLIRSRSSRNALQLGLRVGLRMGVGRVRVAHVAAYPNRASELFGAVEYLLALLDELCGFNVGNLLLARGQPLVHAALRTRATMRYPA